MFPSFKSIFWPQGDLVIIALLLDKTSRHHTEGTDVNKLSTSSEITVGF